MADNPLARKLLIKPGNRLLVLNGPADWPERLGPLWASYPKRSAKVATDLTRDHGWEAFSSAGWRPVTQVSIDDVWSALRFRPLAEVGR